MLDHLEYACRCFFVGKNCLGQRWTVVHPLSKTIRCSPSFWKIWKGVKHIGSLVAQRTAGLWEAASLILWRTDTRGPETIALGSMASPVPSPIFKRNWEKAELGKASRAGLLATGRCAHAGDTTMSAQTLRHAWSASWSPPGCSPQHLLPLRLGTSH